MVRVPVTKKQVQMDELDKTIFPERVTGCIRAQMEVIPVPNIMEVTQLMPTHRIHERFVDQGAHSTAHCPRGGRRTQEQINEIIQVIFQERISERIVEQIADVPLPETVDETMKATQSVPQDRNPESVVEEFVDVCVFHD